MKQIKLLEAINGYSDKPVTGLATAKPGDVIEIGFEGTRFKQLSIISKVVSNDRLQDENGNIFNRNGIIFRKKRTWIKQAGDKIVSARQVTVKEYKKRMMDFVEKQLKNFQWSKLDPEQLIEIGKIIKIGFPQLEDLI